MATFDASTSPNSDERCSECNQVHLKILFEKNSAAPDVDDEAPDVDDLCAAFRRLFNERTGDTVLEVLPDATINEISSSVIAEHASSSAYTSALLLLESEQAFVLAFIRNCSKKHLTSAAGKERHCEKIIDEFLHQRFPNADGSAWKLKVILSNVPCKNWKSPNNVYHNCYGFYDKNDDDSWQKKFKFESISLYVMDETYECVDKKKQDWVRKQREEMLSLINKGSNVSAAYIAKTRRKKPAEWQRIKQLILRTDARIRDALSRAEEREPYRRRLLQRRW